MLAKQLMKFLGKIIKLANPITLNTYLMKPASMMVVQSMMATSEVSTLGWKLQRHAAAVCSLGGLDVFGAFVRNVADCAQLTEYANMHN